jgi:hypothetical protein
MNSVKSYDKMFSHCRNTHELKRNLLGIDNISLLLAHAGVVQTHSLVFACFFGTPSSGFDVVTIKVFVIFKACFPTAMRAGEGFGPVSVAIHSAPSNTLL